MMSVCDGPDEKGRVERALRAIRTLRDTFFAGRSFTDLADLNAQADAWTCLLYTSPSPRD